jgi:NAD(P)-dependent dehydrogenase (short-subunit alcohol dehydrogenase family)
VQEVGHTRTALVTGSSRGIGKAIALRLAAERFNVVLNYATDDAAARDTLGLCRRVTANVMLAKADVSDCSAVASMTDSIVNRFGSIDVLINNAAAVADGPLLEMPEADWQRVVDVVMKGTFLCCQAVARHMVGQEHGGEIINVGARTGLRARKNGINTCAAKAGVMIMTQCLALELAPKVRVNTIIPGLVETEETRVRFHLDDSQVRLGREAEIPMKRIGSPDDVANGVMLLLSKEAGFITGQKLTVDGGQYMW